MAFLTVCQPASPTTGQGGDGGQVATMHAARAAHTATVLPSGEVLIVGGMDHGGGGLASVELFEPADDAVRKIGSLAEARVNHTATLLADGRVLIAGGFNGEYLSSVEVFDPTTRGFQPAGSLLEGRSGHTATLLPDGRVLFVGGVGRGWTFLRSAELYDPRDRPLRGGRLDERRHGRATRRRCSRTAACWSSAATADGARRWRCTRARRSSRRRPVDSRPPARWGSRATSTTPSGWRTAACWSSAGRTAPINVHYETTEVYDPGTGTFEPGPSMANRRYKIAGTSVLLPSGDVLVTSGAPVAELLDVESWAFREVPGRFPAAYRFAAVALLLGGDVLVAGGYSDDNQNTAGIWRFRGL